MWRHNNSVHHEHIYSFLNFLSNLNVSNEIITYIKYFHFNDNTIDGSGKKRKSAIEFITKYKTLTNEINKELDKIKKNILERILFKGEYHNIPEIDYIYYGTIENGLWANKEEIQKYLLEETITTESIHISKIYYQVYHRNLKQNIVYEYRRYYSQFKWHTIEKDLLNITKQRK